MFTLLFVLGLIVIDSFGVCFGTGQSLPVMVPFVIALSLLGFGSGAALGSLFLRRDKAADRLVALLLVDLRAHRHSDNEFIMQFCLQHLLCR